jgi:ferrochelatase
MASTTTIELAEDHRKKVFSRNEIYDSSCLYNKPDYLQNLADSIKGHLEGYDYDHLLFSYHGVPERHIRKTDITKITL